jgi:hypothetical protein
VVVSIEQWWATIRQWIGGTSGKCAKLQKFHCRNVEPYRLQADQIHIAGFATGHRRCGAETRTGPCKLSHIQ